MRGIALQLVELFLTSLKKKTRVEQVQKSFYQMKGDVGMHNAKNHRNKSVHSKMIVQSCVTPGPPYIIQVEGLRMIVLLRILL